MKRISTEIWKQFQPFSQNMPGIKKNTTREATISTNHKTGKKKKVNRGSYDQHEPSAYQVRRKGQTGEATISLNPNKQQKERVAKVIPSKNSQ